MTTTTLVIGARGSIGRHVLDQLLAAGQPVRASVLGRPPVPFAQWAADHAGDFS